MKKRIIGCLVGIIALGVLAICLVGGFSWVGIQEYKDLPRLVSGFDFGTYSEEYTYSQEQANTINSNGYPQNFSILFYHTVDPEGKKVYVRHEVWEYPTIGVSLTFENGIQVGEVSIESYAAIPTNYRPASFTAFISREQLASAAGIDEWFILPVEEELLYDADLYYTEGLTFGLQSDDLVYVEAIGFENPNAPAVELPPEPAPTQQVASPTQESTQAATGEQTAADNPESPSSSLSPEEQAAQGTFDYSVILYEGDSLFGCGTFTAEINIENDTLHLVESSDALDFTRIGENRYTADSEMGKITLTLTPIGYSWSAQEDGITFSLIAIREQPENQQLYTGSGLTIEEMQSSGTHSYQADYCQADEIFDTDYASVDISFLDGNVRMVESEGVDFFSKIGPNRYFDPEDESFHMLFIDKGFIWRLEDEPTDLFVIFTIQQ